MTEENLLYTKQGRDLSYFLNLSRNPQMLLRYSKHYILKISVSDSYLNANLCNDEELLFPEFFLKIKQILEYYKSKHPEDIPALFETYRSNKRQSNLYNEGVTKIKSFGMHHFGIATDIINFKNGRIKWNLNYDTLLYAGNKIGLTNLTPYELCHFQFIPVSSQNDWREFTINLTRVIQDLLNCKVDGILGKITQGAILLNTERLEKYFISLESKLKY